MREFILYSRTGRTDPNFTNLHDAGRLDIVYECIVASLFLSHGLRRNVVFNAFLSGPPNPPLVLEVNGATLYDVRTDEDTWNVILRKILSGKSHPGIAIRKMGFEALLKERAKDATIFVLEERGRDFEDISLGDRPVFILGDHVGLPKTVENYALRHGEKISLGKQPYLAASCITILNFLMDKRSVI